MITLIKKLFTAMRQALRCQRGDHLMAPVMVNKLRVHRQKCTALICVQCGHRLWLPNQALKP